MIDRPVKFSGSFKCRIVRDGQELTDFVGRNTIVLQGLGCLLGSTFATGYPTGYFSFGYLGLFSANRTTLSSDTMANFPSNANEFTGYSQSTRPFFNPAEPESNAIGSASPAIFNITGSTTLYGAFLTNNSTKGGTSGNLFAASQFGIPQNVLTGDTVFLTYHLTAATP